MPANDNDTYNDAASAALERERVNREIADRVAVGEAARADMADTRAAVHSARASAADQRASSYAQGYVQKSVEASDARATRDAAILNAERANDDARSAGTAFWLLLGLAIAALAIGSLWYFNRPDVPVATTTVISREVPASPAASPAAPAVVPVPVPVPVRETVPVPVPAEQREHTTNVTVYPQAPAASPTVEASPAPDSDSDSVSVRVDDNGSTDSGGQ